MQGHLFRNFYCEGHEGFVKDVSITLIEKTDAFDSKKIENCRMRTLRQCLNNSDFSCINLLYRTGLY